MRLILRDGDHAIFDTTFGGAIVTAPAGTLTGSSRVKVGGGRACVLGDEALVVVTAAYSVPLTGSVGGTGLLSIIAVSSDQRSDSSKSAGIPFIIEGSRFQAKLQVVSPASGPSGTDATPMYMGGGAFSTSNTTTSA